MGVYSLDGLSCRTVRGAGDNRWTETLAIKSGLGDGF